jgi:hypothetical protein
VGVRAVRGPVRSVLGLLLIVAALALAGCASSSSAAGPTAGASAPGTATVTVRPFTASGQLTVPVAQHVRGQCWTTSIAAPAPHAYRCFQGDKILDPCFAPAGASAPTQLACLATPWARALVLRVTGSLPKAAGQAPPSRPWALQLANGVRCVASTGTVPAVGGVNLPYHCTDGGDAAVDQPAGTALAAQYAAPRATALTPMRVTTIWAA